MSAVAHITDRATDVEKIDALIDTLADYQPRTVTGRVIRQHCGSGLEPLSHAKAKLMRIREGLAPSPTLSDRHRRELAFVLGVFFSFGLITPEDAKRLGG